MKTNNNSDDLFIHKLLEETYDSIPQEEQSLGHSDLKNYFESKNENESSEISVKKYKDFYRIEIDGNEIDFPNNWGIFSDLENYSDYAITSDNDTDLLLELLSNNTERPYALIFQKQESGDWCLSFKTETEYWDYFNLQEAA